MAVFGELYAEGTFRISGARALRHIFLFEHMLLVTKKKDGGVLNYKTHIIVSDYRNYPHCNCVFRMILIIQKIAKVYRIFSLI